MEQKFHKCHSFIGLHSVSIWFAHKRVAVHRVVPVPHCEFTVTFTHSTSLSPEYRLTGFSILCLEWLNLKYVFVIIAWPLRAFSVFTWFIRSKMESWPACTVVSNLSSNQTVSGVIPWVPGWTVLFQPCLLCLVRDDHSGLHFLRLSSGSTFMGFCLFR